MDNQPLLSDAEIIKLWYEPMPSGLSPSLYDLAHRIEAAAQSHFDRTIEELRSQAKLDSNYRTDLLAAEEKMAEMQAQFDRTLSYQAQEAGKKIMELTRLLREVSDADAAGNDLSRDLIYRIDDALRAEGSGNG
jgi:signal transduction histidine kinase